MAREDRTAIGMGRMARVYSVNGSTAVKVFNDTDDKPVNEWMVIKEIMILKGLHHDNIIELIRVSKGFVGYEMPLMDGDLHRYLQSGNYVRTSLKFKIAIQVANGLAYLHSNNIVHRGIKPVNILLKHIQHVGLVAKIGGFGLALRTNKPFDMRYKHFHWKLDKDHEWISVMSISNLAPELFYHNDAFGEKTDVYAFGILLWCIDTQKIPYDNVRDSGVLIEAVEMGERPDLNPCSLMSGVIEKCWDQDPKKRPKMKEVLDELVFINNKRIK